MIWLWIPKNAGSSISRALLGVHKERAVACHISLDLIWRINPACRDYEVVAFKRNPYSRIVSCWFSKIASPRAVDAPYFRKSKYAGLRHNMPFPEFAAWLNTPEGADGRADQHWISQHLLLGRANRILPFEDLAGSAAELGVPPQRLPHRNDRALLAERSGLKHKTAVEWYDAAAYEQVTRRFAQDLAVLGYGFPGEAPTAQAG